MSPTKKAVSRTSRGKKAADASANRATNRADKPRVSNRPALQPSKPLIVGIGASAGGLDAFKAFFKNMPADTAMTFVLIQHLSPEHKSLLADLLGKVTAMPVIEAENNTTMASNSVYIIPPDATLTLKQRRLLVVKPAPPRERRRPIDTFFSSLADEHGENAVSIVLSGTGSDGSLGLKTIKERGGLTFAQAEFDHHAMSGMPHSATATGFVDEVMRVEDMPAKLVEYQRHLTNIADTKDADGTRLDATPHLDKISALLRARVGHDFSKYKEKTVVRRIQRRMQVLQIDTVEAYVARLKEDPHQIELLFRELLIGVTQFFRDPNAFSALETTVIPKLLENLGADDQVRIWVPGCATGEEVYSIAILIKKALEGRDAVPTVQIFGTDIDERAVAVARSGRYRRITGILPDHLARWFAEEGDEHCPIKAIRDMCVFSIHSVVKDPPFSKLNLISCRNLLIYMDGDLQDRVLRTFHYALKPNGILFLGPAEGVSHQAKLFDALDKKHRIFQRRDSAGVLPALTPSPSPSLPVRTRNREEAPAVAPGADRIERSARRIAEKHSPAYLVVDKHHEIVRFSGGEAGRYLEPSAGAASLNLFDILRKALRPVVRAGLQAALATKEPVEQDDVPLKIDGKIQSVTVIVEPIEERGIDGGLCVVVLKSARVRPERSAKALADAERDGLGAMEHELRTTKTQLQSTIDDLEISNEEMKSATEEYQSVNEELQSSNEELETSKEEMQSINEELQTVNAEMSGKNDTLTRLNSDLKNLLDSTEIATIFLDNDLCIKNFTPAIMDIFHLRDSDRGRPVTDIANLLSYADMEEDARKVQRRLSIVEHEVQLKDSRMTFVMRILPYRTVDNVIDGVVITFIDITARKQAEAAVSESEARYRTLFEAIDDGFCIIEKVDTAPGQPIDFRYLTVNQAFSVQSGVSSVVGMTIREAFPGEPQEWFDTYEAVLRTGESVRFERRLVTQGRLLELFAFRIDDQNQRRVAVIFVDITARKNAEEDLREHAAIVEFSQDAHITATPHGVIASWNPSAMRLFGYSAEEAIGQPISILAPPTQAEEEGAQLKEAIAGNAVGPVEVLRRCKDGSEFEAELTVVPICSANGTILSIAAVVRDITDRRRARQQREMLLQELNHRVKNTLATVQSIASQTLRYATTHEAFERTFSARLIALSKTHDLLTRHNWESTSLRDLLLQELEPYHAGKTPRFALDGEDIQVKSQMALALGMAFHELATNAVKYGALSGTSGQVGVAWNLHDNDGQKRLRLQWIETGGPRVEKPSRTGMGSKLIGQGLAHQLGGDARLEFEPSGLQYTIDVPFS